MYIQITTRCNMRCAHCAFSCTNKGTDMSIITFRKALEIAHDYDHHIVIGGGEPTVHPRFEQMLLESVAGSSEETRPWLATNGKIKRKALMLADLAKAGIIGCDLSQDMWHEDIDEEVVETFQDLGSSIGRFTHIRDVSGSVSRVGRAKTWGDTNDCACDDTFVTPTGVIKQCGCPRSPVIGHVNTGYDSPCSMACYRSKDYKDALKEAA
jgi:MoaA/NifB/PqqE/SkfB family radical SAM enzyme